MLFEKSSCPLPAPQVGHSGHSQAHETFPYTSMGQEWVKAFRSVDVFGGFVFFKPTAKSCTVSPLPRVFLLPSLSGTVLLPNGNIQRPNGDVLYPSGEVRRADGTIQLADGSIAPAGYTIPTFSLPCFGQTKVWASWCCEHALNYLVIFVHSRISILNAPNSPTCLIPPPEISQVFF